MPRTYTQRDLKLLFGLSGGRCAAPGCPVRLFLPGATSGEATVLGQICHIIASSDSGPRGDPEVSPNDRNSYPNLILLCAHHHALIDSDPLRYPASVLRSWKARRERTEHVGPLQAHVEVEPRIPWEVAMADVSALKEESAPGADVHTVEQYRWLLAKGARDLYQTRVLVNLTNTGSTPIVIRRLEAQTVTRAPSPRRHSLEQPTAGAQWASVFRLDLEDAAPVAYTVDGEGAGPPDRDTREEQKARGRLVIPVGGVEECIVIGFSRHTDVHWHLRLKVVAEGETFVTSLSEPGDEPFVTVGMPEQGPFSRWLCPGIAGPRFQTWDEALADGLDGQDG